jgi:hypothetical protein
MLEPYAVKVASTVLKGLGVGNDLRLLDRISRSTALNFALITITSVTFTLIRLQTISSFWKLLFFEFILGTIFTLIAIWTWIQLTNTFYKQLGENESILLTDKIS